MAVAEPDASFRVAGVEREARRSQGDELLDLTRIEADVAAGPVDNGTATPEDVESAIAEDLDPDLGEDPQ